MDSTQELRMSETKHTLIDNLTHVAGSAFFFLGALQGFRRDLATSVEAMPQYISAEFLAPAHQLAVPEMTDGMSFAGLEQMLLLCEDAMDGSIHFKNPKLGPDGGDKKRLLEEGSMIHANLLKVADQARLLYEAATSATFEFDVFNTKNIEVGFRKANILFDRDSLNACTSLARALSERAVRLDIDLTESLERLSFGERQQY